MKRIGVVLGVAAVMAATVALTAGTALAQAQSATIVEREPVTFVVTSPCTGEQVFVEGTLLLVSHSTADAAGGSHFKDQFHFAGQGVSTSGAKYIISSGFNNQATLGADSADNHTFVVHTNWIRQGSDTPEDDFQGHRVLHFTQNANGEITVAFDEYPQKCR